MEQQNNYDKTTFKVKFLGEYHDMVIDWNDDKYEYKQQQVFEQLASLTGIQVKYKLLLWLYAKRPVYLYDYPNDHIGQTYLSFANNTHLYPDRKYPDTFVKDNIHDVCIRDGERFHLSFYPFYDIYFMKRIGVSYDLVPETWVQEGVCSYRFCQHKNTKTYFNKIKDLVNNDSLNSQIWHRVQPIEEIISNNRTFNPYLEVDKILRQFNVQQYLRNECYYVYHRDSVASGDRRQINLYLRMRG